MLKAYKYRAYPTEAQNTLRSKTFGDRRFIGNTILRDLKRVYAAAKDFNFLNL